MEVPSDAVREAVNEMRNVLAGNSIQAKREMLTGMIVNFKMDRTFGKLLYTFPLSKLTGK